MARPRDKVRSERVRIDGRLKRGVDPRVDALLGWLDSLPSKKRFPLVVQRLLMGGVMEDITTGGDVEAARKAAEDIARNFVAEE
jgi:hypothetical protein